MYFIDTNKDATYTYERIGVVAEVKNGTLTFTYTDKEGNVSSIDLEGKNERPEDAGYATIKEWIAAQSKSKNPGQSAPANLTEDQWFASDGLTTRGAVVTALYRMEGQPAVSGTQQFTDIGNTWYSDAVRWAAEHNILAGYGNGTTRPGQRVTREELVTLLYRYAMYKQGVNELPGKSINSYLDAEKVSTFARKAVSWAVEEELMQGSGNKLEPESTVSRDYFTDLLMKLQTVTAK